MAVDWGTILDALGAAMLSHIQGQPCVGSVSIGDKSITWVNLSELTKYYNQIKAIKDSETAPTPTTRIMYGRGV